MGKIAKTFTFETGPMGLVQYSDPHDSVPPILWGWQSGDSPNGPGGCMRFATDLGGLGPIPSDPVAYASNFCARDTWNSWGVPLRKIVTGVRVVSWYQRTVANTLMLRQAAGITIAGRDLTSIIADDGWLVSPLELSTSLTSWTAEGPGDVKGIVDLGNARSTSDVTLVVAYALRTSAGTADIDWRFDDVTLEITYKDDPNPPCPPRPSRGRGGGCC